MPKQAKHMLRTRLFIQFLILLTVDQPHRAVYCPYKAIVVYISYIYEALMLPTQSDICKS